MWVCRAGPKSVFVDYYLETKKIYIPWDGFKADLNDYDDRETLKKLVINEKGDVSRTSISNWAGQLYTFCREMQNGDYVLVPYANSKKYILAKVCGNYTYDSENEKALWHSRNIKVIHTDVPNNIFSQSVWYSLGAYRTVFKAKNEEYIIDAINSYYTKK